MFTMIRVWSCILLATVWGQNTPTEEPYYDDRVSDNFIVPDPVVAGEVDRFTINNTEYLFVNSKLTFPIALTLCREDYQSSLAFVRNFDLAYFLAEALSETNLVFDTLWIGGKKEGNSDEWNWESENESEPIDKEIVGSFVFNQDIEANDRRCLGFSRSNHETPQFRPLTCRARRAAMCQRPATDITSDHTGWIRLGKRLYKIFTEKLPKVEAMFRCTDVNASLAVLLSTEHCQQLGRYLLIGRPSLELAWIGGEWENNKYVFSDESIQLSNTSDMTGYPPWRNKHMMKPYGCLTLDRHMFDTTYFVEKDCDRRHAYICYKFVENYTDITDHADVIVGNFGYRLHYIEVTWEDAINYCKERYANYLSRLVEVREEKQVHHLLYVMGENKTAVQHIWIGGKYTGISKQLQEWQWVSNGDQISTGNDAILHWVKNSSYEHEIEKGYTCLVMDRENHIVAMHYGAACYYEHSFVCEFTAEKLQQLQEDEKKNITLLNEIEGKHLLL